MQTNKPTPRFERPKQLSEALALLETREWDILAGGTDYFPGLGDGPPPGPVLDISSIRDLRRIEFKDDFWKIGALATWSDLVEKDLPPAFQGLKLAAREIGSIQIQNQATIVGNICNASPAADGVPPLLVLDALVEIASADGLRRQVLSDFIQGNRKTALAKNEMVTALLIPRQSASGVSSFLKLGARKYLVISIAMAAVRLVLDDKMLITGAAASVGACSVVAERLPALETSLAGRKITDDIAGLVTRVELGQLTPISDVRATEEFRLDAAQELVRRALNMAVLEARNP